MMPKPASFHRSNLIAFLMILSVQGCSSSTTLAQGNIDSLAKSKLGNKYEISYNESKQYALCQQSSTNADHALRNYKFIVVRVSDNMITNEGSFKNGYVKWINNDAIEISSSGTDEKSQTQILKIKDQQS